MNSGQSWLNVGSGLTLTKSLILLPDRAARTNTESPVLGIVVEGGNPRDQRMVLCTLETMCFSVVVRGNVTCHVRLVEQRSLRVKLKLDAPKPETAGRANQIGAPQSLPAFDKL
jgi:hypothetical protein